MIAKKYLIITWFVYIFFCNFLLCILGNVFSFVFLLSRIIAVKGRKTEKLQLFLVYCMILAFQIIFLILVYEREYFLHYLMKAMSFLLFLVPFELERVILVNKSAEIKIPNVKDSGVIAYSKFLNIKNNIDKQELKDFLSTLTKTSYVRYINKNTLTKEYFDLCFKSLEDENIYIIVTNTGSIASRLINLFTKTEFNHASLAFDKELETIVSYNGGVNLFMPGLNSEMIEYSVKKKYNVMYIYSLKITREQKMKMIDKITEINERGSAYNFIGIFIRKSMRSNIMYCSQFIYTMLKVADAQYFEKTIVSPTDFIELDYERKLKLVKKIELKTEESTKN